MSVVISSSFVVSPSVSGGGTINADNPLIGWHSIVADATISTTTEEAEFPADFMANPATHLRWVGQLASPAVDEYVTVTNPDLVDLDYIAIARHNFFTAQIPVSVEYLDVNSSPEAWVELIAEVLLPNDGPALFRFPKLPYAAIRLRLQPGTAAPTIAAVYCGALLVLQRRVYVGHTPIPYGRELMIANHRSVAGNFLGRIVLGKKTKTAANLQNLTADWYRANMEPFLQNAQERPFFFAWRPSSYPYEVGYCWLVNDPMPKNQLANGMMQVDLQMEGVV